MNKSIGPTFTSELLAANVSLDGWSWGADGSFSFGDVSPSVQAQILAVYDAHNPAAQVQTPNAEGFTTQLKTVFGNDATLMNTLLTKYPLFLRALDGKNYDYMKLLLGQALSAGDITAQQQADMYQAGLQYNIPLT